MGETQGPKVREAQRRKMPALSGEISQDWTRGDHIRAVRRKMSVCSLSRKARIKNSWWRGKLTKTKAFRCFSPALSFLFVF